MRLKIRKYMYNTYMYMYIPEVEDYHVQKNFYCVCVCCGVRYHSTPPPPRADSGITKTIPLTKLALLENGSV